MEKFIISNDASYNVHNINTVMVLRLNHKHMEYYIVKQTAFMNKAIINFVMSFWDKFIN